MKEICMNDYKRCCYFKVVKKVQVVNHLVMDIASIMFLVTQPMVIALVVVHQGMLVIIATKVSTLNPFLKFYFYQCSCKKFQRSFKLVFFYLKFMYVIYAYQTIIIKWKSWIFKKYWEVSLLLYSCSGIFLLTLSPARSPFIINRLKNNIS